MIRWAPSNQPILRGWKDVAKHIHVAWMKRSGIQVHAATDWIY